MPVPMQEEPLMETQSLTFKETDPILKPAVMKVVLSLKQED
jgi:hypothetical protein